MSLIMGWPHPRVLDEQRTGPAHDPRFTVSCVFHKFKTFATSRSKRDAKRLATADMHEKMRYQSDIMYKYSLRTGKPLVLYCTDEKNIVLIWWSNNFSNRLVSSTGRFCHSHRRRRLVDWLASPLRHFGRLLLQRSTQCPSSCSVPHNGYAAERNQEHWRDRNSRKRST